MKIIFRSFLLIFLLLSSSLLFFGCEPENERVGGFPAEGQIWADVEDLSYTFDDVGSTLPSISNTYSESVKSLSMYRITAPSSIRFGTFRILLTRFDFDNTTPRILDNSNITLAFSPEPNNTYQAIGGDIQFEVLSIENDVIKANFSGTLINTLNPNQALRVRNGAVHIRIRRE